MRFIQPIQDAQSKAQKSYESWRKCFSFRGKKNPTKKPPDMTEPSQIFKLECSKYTNLHIW